MLRQQSVQEEKDELFMSGYNDGYTGVSYIISNQEE
jgi:hypothetical protein